MANDLNLCQFIGRLGADPEVRYMPSGEPVANIRIAVGAKWKNKQTGNQEERTEWVNCVMFGKLAEMVSQWWKKGTQVYISGNMRTRKWQDQSGADRYSTEIVVEKVQTLKDGVQSGQQGGNQNQPQNQQYSQQHPAQQSQQPGQGFDDFQDDIPF